MLFSKFSISDDVDDNDSGHSGSKGFLIKKAKGSRNLLEICRDRCVTMENWDNEEDEKTYKGIYSRNRLSPGSDSPKKKEISWADRIIGSRKFLKQERAEKNDSNKENVSIKSLVKTNKEKKKDPVRHVTQTSVVYFSKSNSYDGRVIMASRCEGKDKIKDKMREKKHHRKHCKHKQSESNRESCMDAALAAAAVRAVVGVIPQPSITQGMLPRAYRVRTSLSHSFLVEPVWNDGQQSKETSDASRPLTAPDDSSSLDSVRSRQNTGFELTCAENNRTSNTGTSGPWTNRHAMIPVPSNTANSSHTQALAVHDDSRLPCNVSVNIQLVASNSNMTARALLTDGSGISREVPAKISWESNQSKTAAISVLDSLSVAKSIEQALAKAVVENAKTFSTRLTTSSHTILLEKGTTTASLENTIKLPLIEKSTNTVFELLSVDSIERETSVTEASVSNEGLQKNAPMGRKLNDTDTSSYNILIKPPSQDYSIHNNTPEYEDKIFTAEKHCFQKKQTEERTVAFLETDIRFKDPKSSSGENEDQNTVLIKTPSSVEHITPSREQTPQGISKAHESESIIRPKSERECCRLERSLGEEKEEDTKTSVVGSNEEDSFKTIDEKSSQETSNVNNLETNFLNEATKRAVAEGWVTEVNRMVTEELKTRSMIEKNILLQERRIAMEERKSRKGRNSMIERSKLEEQVALEVRKVLDERSACKELPVHVDYSSEENMMDVKERETNDVQKTEDKKTSENSLTTTVNGSRDPHSKCETRKVLRHEQTEQSSEEQSLIIQQDSAFAGDHLATEERKRVQQRSQRRSSSSKQRKEQIDRAITEADLKADNSEEKPSLLEDQILMEDQVAAPSPMHAPWNGEVGKSDFQEQLVLEEQLQAKVGGNAQTVIYEGGVMEERARAMSPQLSQPISQQETPQSTYAHNLNGFAPLTNSTQDSVSHNPQDPAAMVNFRMAANSNMSGPSNYSQYPQQEDNFYVPQDATSPASPPAPSNGVTNAGSLPVPNAPMGPPYNAAYPAPMGNSRGVSWPNATMNPLSHYGGVAPMQQPWFLPQQNPFMSGTWPYPGMMPYRFMMPYRNGQTNLLSSTSTYSTLTGGQGRVACHPNILSGAPRMSGCMPLGYVTARNVHPQFMPFHNSNSKTPDPAVCGMPDPRFACGQKADVASTTLRTLFSKDMEDENLSKSMEMANTVGEELEDESFNSNSLSENSFVPHSENTSIAPDNIPQDEEAVSELECSLVDLLRKCSLALGQQANELAGDVDEQPAVQQHSQFSSLMRREETDPGRAEGDDTTPSIPALTRAARMRNMDDPLELLRQLRVRQQEREVTRPRIPGPKMPLRRNKVVTLSGKKKFNEN